MAFVVVVAPELQLRSVYVASDDHVGNVGRRGPSIAIEIGILDETSDEEQFHLDIVGRRGCSTAVEIRIFGETSDDTQCRRMYRRTS